MPVHQCDHRASAAASRTNISGKCAQDAWQPKKDAMLTQNGKQLEQRGCGDQQDQADDI